MHAALDEGHPPFCTVVFCSYGDFPSKRAWGKKNLTAKPSCVQAARPLHVAIGAAASFSFSLVLSHLREQVPRDAHHSRSVYYSGEVIKML